MPEPIRLIINGEQRPVAWEPGRSLLVVLREELGLTGAKYGCAAGACGACTVLIDGAPARACITSLADADGRAVTTIEGLTRDDRLNPVQEALVAASAMQCGYCTPGMVMSATALLGHVAGPGGEQVIRALDGNICRCCAYPRILTALRQAAARRTAESPGAAATARAVAHPAARTELDPPRAPWDLLPPHERGYFDVLPDGLVAVLPPGGRPGGPPGPWQRSGGAWVHVGADGAVTAFTGKVDVGQDNKTALALLVAEELSVPLASVRMVMGDTDVCPYDMGTFGSLSMPHAGRDLAAAAAAARQALVAMAATAWEVDPAGLRATDGAVKDGSAGAAVSYGELLRGARRMVTAARDATVSDRRAWRTAGQPAPKPDMARTVTGTRPFTSDLSLPGMLHGKVLRPPAYGATLRTVHLSRARSVPGVIAVHEGGFTAVAAGDPAAAAHALELVEADWECPPQAGEEDLVRHLRRNPVDIEGWGGRFRDEAGDVTAALAEADVQLAATYTTAYIAHVPLEPRAALARWSAGRLTVWTGTQRPFRVREEIAQELGVAEADVRVIVPPTGSGFGGKHAGTVAAEAAKLARAAGRPVKVQWSRAEEFTCGYFRPAAVIDVAAGARYDGAGRSCALTAWEFTNINSGAAGILTPYHVPNKRIVFQPARSPLPQGSYRALAATANNFARESHMDELARQVGVDPVRWRLAHLRDDRLANVLRAAAERAGWPQGRQGAPAGGHALGIACGLEKDGRVATCAEVSVTGDGRLTVHRIVTAYECGTIVNPDNVVNQIEGATVMALGGALFEAIHFDNGVILNASLSGYRVPRFSDVPPIDVILLDRRDFPPAGAGETPVIAVAPALANAIFAATGKRIRAMPLLPDGVVPVS